MYYHWNQNFPEVITPDFISFIDSNTPLAQKLREKWLYKLAQKKEWLTFKRYYHFSSDINLQCFAQIANYYTGAAPLALKESKRLWLTGDNLPKSCDILFKLQGSALLTEPLLNRRIALALEKRNLSLVRHLLKLYNKPKVDDDLMLLQIAANPRRINLLTPGPLHGDLYLYGLKRLVSMNINEAVRVWNLPITKKILSNEQQQLFLSHLAFYQAMRNDPESDQWFAQVQPAYRTDILSDWQIRHAIKQQKWTRVKALIKTARNNQTPIWQYWLARALENTNEIKLANELYQKLARTRHYYGFLASIRLKQPLSLQDEPLTPSSSILNAYKPFTSMVRELIRNKQDSEASRIISDFTSELPKKDKQLIIYWLINDLKWYAKALNLSSSEELSNALALRFPLPYNSAVHQSSKQFQIPKELIYAIIRQESGFREEVTSPAGAKGLMQIMPTTAMMIVQKKKFDSRLNDSLFVAQQNITLGSAYLQYLAKHFQYHFALMAAAYNAGPRQVNVWLKTPNSEPLDIWIETIPWHETRNYLKNVMSFYVVYQYRLGVKPNLDYFLKPLA